MGARLEQSDVSCTSLASSPNSSPAFCCILYSMRQKTGEEPGNEAAPDTACTVCTQCAVIMIVRSAAGGGGLL